MTLPSRRAFATAAMASLLVGCGGHRTGRATAERPRGTPSSTRPPAKAAHALGRSVPVRLQVPAIEVDTPLMRLGLAPDGTVQVPPIAADDRAGWYRHSPTPGQIGPSVILGHVTVGAYGDGVFRDLARLRRGERIVARLENGKLPLHLATPGAPVSPTVPLAPPPASSPWTAPTPSASPEPVNPRPSERPRSEGPATPGNPAVSTRTVPATPPTPQSVEPPVRPGADAGAEGGTRP
ncbi:sortase [Streptomyces sp. 21So2-11]|uniref:sortase domain-containing protein n=1 Tax=Streptomyces sp. 21So2-11 TaxID=3144408 RepID=UPI00321C0680